MNRALGKTMPFIAALQDSGHQNTQHVAHDHLRRTLPQLVVLELALAVVFFVANYAWGLMAATGAVMAATLLTTAIGLVTENRVPVLAVVTLVLVLTLGGTSLLFDDETYIKIKPTVGKCLFALALAVGLQFRESLLRRAFGGQLHLTDPGWRMLTVCCIAPPGLCRGERSRLANAGHG